MKIVTIGNADLLTLYILRGNLIRDLEAARAQALESSRSSSALYRLPDSAKELEKGIAALDNLLK